jgi:hypothetical protein
LTSARMSALALAVLLAGVSLSSHASIIKFDVTGLDDLGPQVGVAFDFLDGDGVSNSVLVHGLASNGTAGPASFVGGASAVAGGYLLEDSDFFSSLTLEYVNASHLSLLLTTSNIAPALGMFADSLAIYLVDVSNGLPLLFTDELLGTNALFSWTATGQGDGELNVYGAAMPSVTAWTASFVSGPVNGVPEPGVLSLFGFGLAGWLAMKSQRKEG